jgi:hypothetical protein
MADAIMRLPRVSKNRRKMFADDVRYDRVPLNVFDLACDLEVDSDLLIKELRAVYEERVGVMLTPFREVQ